MNFTNANTTDGATSDGVVGGNTDENAALYLQGVTQVDLINLVIDGAVQHGINGNNVTDLDISGTTIQNAGDEVWESSIYIIDLKGVASAGRTNVFNNLNITNDSGQFNIFLQNNDGTNDRPAEKDRLEITNSQFTRNGNNFLISDNVSCLQLGHRELPGRSQRLDIHGDRNVRCAAVCRCMRIRQHPGRRRQQRRLRCGHHTGNNFTAGNAGQAAVNISASGAGQGTFNVQNVTSTVRASTGINVALTTTNPAASLRGTIANNNPRNLRHATIPPQASIWLSRELARWSWTSTTTRSAAPTPQGSTTGSAEAPGPDRERLTSRSTTTPRSARPQECGSSQGMPSAGETSRTCVNFTGNNIDGGATSFADYFVEMYINTAFQLQGFAGVGTNAAQVAAFIASRDDDAGSLVDAGSGTTVNYRAQSARHPDRSGECCRSGCSGPWVATVSGITGATRPRTGLAVAELIKAQSCGRGIFEGTSEIHSW